ncbi:hypothetical protein Trydic_g23001 [Trypoxylus dichotomus]
MDAATVPAKNFQGRFSLQLPRWEQFINLGVSIVVLRGLYLSELSIAVSTCCLVLLEADVAKSFGCLNVNDNKRIRSIVCISRSYGKIDSL